jgi:hypothetical protein
MWKHKEIRQDSVIFHRKTKFITEWKHTTISLDPSYCVFQGNFGFRNVTVQTIEADMKLPNFGKKAV